LLRKLCWLLLKRTCCAEITGCWFAPKPYWSREKRWLLGLITKRYWLREKRWLLGLITKRYWSREKRWLLGLITKRYWSRKNRRLSHALTASVAPPVVSRANSFRSAAGRIARKQLP
jgi:hypothetical protein